MLDLDKLEKRYLEYWNKENHDRPLLDIRAPKTNARVSVPEFHGTIEERWMDTEYVLKSSRASLQNTYFGGESYPLLWPNLGPDIFGAYFGIDLKFGNDTSWAANHFTDLSKTDCSRLDLNNKWLKKTIEMTEAFASESKGDYLVGITDIHAGMDALISLRGPEETCFDLYECPELVKEKTFQLCDRFKEVYNLLNGILAKYQKGNGNWMSVYHPQGWYVTSCDFLCMISNEMYKEFVEPELLEELAFFKHSIFHLDGPGALHHLDSLLAIPELNGIQWVYGAGNPTAAHWIPVLKKIQDAGKLIHITVVPSDIPVLLENLKPEGMLIQLFCESEEEAKDIVRYVEKNTIRR